MANVGGIEIKERHDIDDVLVALDLNHRGSEELNATINRSSDELRSVIKNELDALSTKLNKVPEEIVELANKAIKVKVDQRLHYKALFFTSISSAFLGLALGIYLGGNAPYELYKQTLLASLNEQVANYKDAANRASLIEADYKQKVEIFEKEKAKAVKTVVDQERKSQNRITRELERNLNVIKNIATKVSFDANSQTLILQLRDDEEVFSEQKLCDDIINRCLFIRRNSN